MPRWYVGRFWWLGVLGGGVARLVGGMVLLVVVVVVEVGRVLAWGLIVALLALRACDVGLVVIEVVLSERPFELAGTTLSRVLMSCVWVVMLLALLVGFESALEKWV